MMLSNWIDRLGDWNPQLFRELKGRLTLKSLGIAGVVSFLLQGLVYFSFIGSLPDPKMDRDYYCTGSAIVNFEYNSPYYAHDFCLKDALGNVIINWHLWWSEIFFTLSLGGFFILLLGGVYLLIQDLGKEEKIGTLNFVRLSPQSATAIATGKILGVPCLVYSSIAFALPLHFWAGLKGGMPLHLIGLFYSVVTACCLFFYSGAMLFALVSQGGAALKAWLATGGLFYAMGTSTMFVVHEHNHMRNLMDGIILLNPLHILTYLTQTNPAKDKLFWFQYDSFSAVSFFRVELWHWVAIAAFVHFVIYGIGTYWFSQAFKRKFHNHQATLLSKKQSYLLTALLTIFCLGFTVQIPLSYTNNQNNWLFNFSSLSVCNVFYLLILIAVLSPAYQSIQDWSRYQNHSIKEWLLGERSPAFWAIILNGLIAFVPMAIAALWVMESQYKAAFMYGLVLQFLMVALLMIIAQRLLLNKNQRRAVTTSTFVFAGIFLPLIVLAINTVEPTITTAPWLWTIVPMVATQNATLWTIMATVLGQTAAIALIHQGVQSRLNKMGRSELQQLLSSNTPVNS